jgi:hypothetical protein
MGYLLQSRRENAQREMARMEKIWYLLMDGEEEGPYSVLDLRRHRRVTPDTLVRRAGQKKWLRIRDVRELKKVFQDAEDSSAPSKKGSSRTCEDGTLAMNYDPPSFLFWLLLMLLILLYAIYQLGQHG